MIGKKIKTKVLRKEEIYEVEPGRLVADASTLDWPVGQHPLAVEVEGFERLALVDIYSNEDEILSWRFRNIAGLELTVFND